MTIDNRDLPVGTRLEATYKKTRYVCEVEAGEEGKLAFVLEDGKRFSSPSAAASAVMGGQAANGWRFWRLEGSEPTTKATTPKTKTSTKAGAKPKTASSKHNGRMASFLGFAGAEPEQCPEGHRIDDPELSGASAVVS